MGKAIDAVAWASSKRLTDRLQQPSLTRQLQETPDLQSERKPKIVSFATSDVVDHAEMMVEEIFHGLEEDQLASAAEQQWNELTVDVVFAAFGR